MRGGKRARANLWHSPCCVSAYKCWMLLGGMIGSQVDVQKGRLRLPSGQGGLCLRQGPRQWSTGRWENCTVWSFSPFLLVLIFLRSPWEMLLRRNSVKWSLKIATKRKKYIGWKREFRWPVIARQPNFGLMLCWICVHKPQVFFKTCSGSAASSSSCQEFWFPQQPRI